MVLPEVTSTLLQLVVFTLLPFLVFLVRRRSIAGFWDYIGLYSSPAAANGWALLTSVVFVGSTLGLALFNPVVKAVMLDTHSTTGQLRLAGIGPASLLVLLLTALVKTALAEEILFRGFIAKRLIARCGFTIGNLLQAMLFGVLHLGLFWMIHPGTLALSVIFFGATAGAALAAYLNERLANGSIIPGWLAHGVANLISYSVVSFGG